MINKILSKNMRSLETLKQLIRPFCKLGKCITFHNFGLSCRSGERFVRPHILIPVHIFFPSRAPNDAKQGVLYACFKIPSETPGQFWLCHIQNLCDKGTKTHP